MDTLATRRPHPSARTIPTVPLVSFIVGELQTAEIRDVGPRRAIRIIVGDPRGVESLPRRAPRVGRTGPGRAPGPGGEAIDQKSVTAAAFETRIPPAIGSEG